MRAARLALVALVAAATATARPSCSERLSWSGASVERRTRRAGLVFHGLAVETYPPVDPPPPRAHPYTAQFWLISVYKGARRLAPVMGYEKTVNGVYDIRDRRVNVTGFYRPNATDTPRCWAAVTSQKYYVVFAEVGAGGGLEVRDDETAGSIADWTERNEARVWRAIGWDEWSDWSVCSKSCDGGTQQRWRYCLQQAGCQGYNKQTRVCNSFTCTGTVAPLSLEGKRQWERVPGRETAWRLRSSSYFWLPAAQLPFPADYFRNHFALILSLRLDPKKAAGGTLFSLKSRHREECYFSVELEGSDAIKMVHSGPNGTQSVLIPALLSDGKWHQLALGIQDDSSVRSYFDCRWVSTDILKKNALDIPDDADLIIGYLFSGELEQMVIVGDPGGVAQQCSTNLTPVLDPILEAARPHKHKPKQGSKKQRWDERHMTTEFPDLSDDEDLIYEGSGTEQVLEDEWSDCSVTCGLGVQVARCRDEPCLSRTRACNAGSCPHTATCEPPCQNGGFCWSNNQCHCPENTSGSRCQNFTCPEGCGVGRCVGPGLCECSGDVVAPRCGAVCEPPCAHGATCTPGNTCRCPPGVTGHRCQDKKCESRPVQEPYTRGFRKLVKKRYETKCEPLSWKTCIRTVPEYQTVYKTFYRTVYKCLDQP